MMIGRVLRRVVGVAMIVCFAANLKQKQLLTDSPLHEVLHTKVYAFLSGPGSTITPSGLVRLLQEAAMVNTLRLKLSSPELMASDGLSWVLRRQHVQVRRWPVMNEALKIVTAPTGFHRRLQTFRDFYVYDQTDQLIATAATEWLLMDLKSRRLRPIPQRVLAISEGLIDAEHRLSPPPGKNWAGDLVDHTYTTRVRHSQLDFNNHLTNPAYVDLLLDGAPHECTEALKLTGFAIEFLEEARWRDELTIHCTAVRQEDGTAEIYKKVDRLDEPPTVRLQHRLLRGDATLATMRSSWW